MYAKCVEELRIYTKALELSKEIGVLTNKVPYFWGIKEVNQIKRSSCSVSPNIAEGFAQRFYPKKFIYYLNIALGSSDETQSHLKELFNKSHIQEFDYKYLIFEYKKLSVQILNMINTQRKRHKF